MRGFSLIVVLMVCMLEGYSQTCKQKAPPADVKKMAALIGEWQGEFTQGSGTSRLHFRIYEENQELKVKVTNDAWGPGETVADASLCSENKFHFFGNGMGGSFTYNARLIDGELVGNMTIGESCSSSKGNSFRIRKVKV